MLHDESIRIVNESRLDAHFVRPIYDSFGFAQIPATIEGFFTGKPAGIPFGPRADMYVEYDRVVLVLLDAFGWRFFEQYADTHPFLKRFVDQGLVVKLTSQFPSTTAAHVTTIHTGKTVGQSGVYEWFQYEPSLDALIAPLLFSFVGDSDRETLTEVGFPPERLLPRRSFYHQLTYLGVEPFVMQHIGYAHSSYSRVVTAGASMLPYRTLSEGIVCLEQHAATRRQRSYYFLYFDAIDIIGHARGPGSPHFAAEIQTNLDILERLLQPALTQLPGRTLLLVTADHGQIATDPGATIYLDRELPALTPMLKTSATGQPLVPAGSNRDFFLHVRPGQLDAACSLLERHLEGRALVTPVAKLIEQGFFGPSVSPTFLSRVGDLVVLPYAGESVWWSGEGRFVKRHRGTHGGLCPEEMETMLLALNYS